MKTTVPLVPKNPDGVLWVLVMGRISTIHQNTENIDASYRYVENYLNQIYQGPMHLKHLGEQASGMRTDRATIREAEDEIETGTWDLVITKDLGRFYRNPRHQYAFVQNAVDCDTRVICIGDNLDTSDENWEVAMGAASLRHGLSIPDTRRRVRRTAVHAFHGGGMVQKIRFGYRKLTKEEAESGQFSPKGLRLAKAPECTPTLREMKERVLRGDHYESVADWLEDNGVIPGPYVTSGHWTGKLVADLLRDPILSGQRTFGDVKSQPIFKTGRYRRRKNPEGPIVENYPELAHFTQEEHLELIQAMDRRMAERCPRSGREHPLYDKPRSRTIWPAQHARCAACGGIMHLYEDGQLKCSNSPKHARPRCWCHVQVDGERVRRSALAWLLENCSQVTEFRPALVDAAWVEFQKQRQREERKQGQNDQEIQELHKRAANLAKAISMGEELDTLVQELREVENQLRAVKARAARHDERLPLTHGLTKEEIDERLTEVLPELARTSYEFAGLMRRIIPEFLIQPATTLDGYVRPRAKLTVRLWALAETGTGNDDSESCQADVHVALDLFEPPVHIRHMAACLAEKAKDPRLSLKKIASRLGINHMTVKRALDYARRMAQAGWDEPYRELTTQPPTSASRWKSDRKTV